MKIYCQERYDSIANYAKYIDDSSFQKCIDTLKGWEDRSKGRYEVQLTFDFAPYSMLFAEIGKGGVCGVNGGLIYHGSPDLSNSIQLVPTQGWSIHT